jgi:hypothetical protein
MPIQSFGLSHQGLLREHNEDRFLCDDKEGAYLVAPYSALPVPGFVLSYPCSGDPFPCFPVVLLPSDHNLVDRLFII